MKTAIEYLQFSTRDFLIKKFSNVADYRAANELLVDLCGIEGFFNYQEDFLSFLRFLEPSFVVREGTDRREYGDFQTPYELTDSICEFLLNEGISPDIIIEPTFGKGSFLISSLKYFSKLKSIYGIEIYESYYWQSKFSILEFFINNQNLNKPGIFLYLGDVFKFDFKRIENYIGNYNVLILGNPPWVTNAELGSLNSNNLPPKSNFKRLSGLESITGKGNFDIGEYIIIMMINLFSKFNGTIAMLAKNSVIKNLVYDLRKTKYNISNIFSLKIDAKKHFNASVNSSLFKCDFISNKNSIICKVSFFDAPNSIEKQFGWTDNKFVSDIDNYKNYNNYDGISPFIWRQGVKHDCSKIMELDFKNNKYVNGINKELDIENELIYGLVKSSDLSSVVIKKPRKYVVITQRRIGEDTTYLSYKFPNLYKYLKENENYFKKRKSSIYKNRPQFSIFGIGEYSFKPYKVAISGLYKRSMFSLILPELGKPLMLDDTCYFIGFDDFSESIIAWAILNSENVQQLLKAIIFLDSKRPFTKDILMRIGIDKVANNMTYDEVIKQIKILNNKISCNVTKNNWNDFIEKVNKKNLYNKQYSLF